MIRNMCIFYKNNEYWGINNLKEHFGKSSQRYCRYGIFRGADSLVG